MNKQENFKFTSIYAYKKKWRHNGGVIYVYKYIRRHSGSVIYAYKYNRRHNGSVSRLRDVKILS